MTPCIQQLRTWFKNRGRVRGTSKSLSSLLAATGSTRKRTRLPQPQELFSKNHYDTLIRPAVEAKLAELHASKGAKLDKKEVFNTVKACIAAAYNTASDDLRAGILKERAEIRERSRLAHEAAALQPTAPRTPEDYQK